MVPVVIFQRQRNSKIAFMSNLPPELLIGVLSIDREHHALVTLLDRLILRPKGNLGSAHFSEVLSLLGNMLTEHFNNEEMCFTACGMPADDVRAHQKAHNEILEQYTQLNLDLMANKVISPTDVARMIKEWIVDHLVEHDLKIRPYASSQPSQPTSVETQ